MSKKYYWKVVFRDPNIFCRRSKYYSAVVSRKAQVRYYINRWIKAPDWLADQGYHIIVFNKKSDAKIFAESRYNFDSLEIFKCIVKNEIKGKTYCSLLSLQNGTIRQDINSSWPQGTHIFEKIKLIPNKKAIRK